MACVEEAEYCILEYQSNSKLLLDPKERQYVQIILQQFVLDQVSINNYVIGLSFGYISILRFYPFFTCSRIFLCCKM